ncbi:hypothetical protein Chor_009502 [Crotalus horridus]
MQNGLPVSPPQEVAGRGTKVRKQQTFLPCFSKRAIMDKDYVGFATLPTQVHRKTVKKGFDFTLMVAGYCYISATNYTLDLDSVLKDT